MGRLLCAGGVRTVMTKSKAGNSIKLNHDWECLRSVELFLPEQGKLGGLVKNDFMIFFRFWNFTEI